ncbi:Spy/CpxP family protein refolding chaperone [Atrimonas thermophila]|jgi:Spy/CpxP family protein refolding chaperone|uniref:Spy/CpxP family protein refolding chaperone n=1 Tax=Atrimonas thermophila TaxID=3064161 RepID=UPI00399CFD79
MKKKTLIGLLVGVVLVLGVAFSAFALAGPGRGWMWQEEGIVSFLDKQFDLTDEQEAKLDELRVQMFEELKPLRLELQQIQMDLQEARLKGESGEVIKEKLSQLLDLWDKIQEVHLKYAKEFLNLLTPEQLSKASFPAFPGWGFFGGKPGDTDRPGFRPFDGRRAPLQRRAGPCW